MFVSNIIIPSKNVTENYICQQKCPPFLRAIKIRLTCLVFFKFVIKENTMHDHVIA